MSKHKAVLYITSFLVYSLQGETIKQPCRGISPDICMILNEIKKGVRIKSETNYQKMRKNISHLLKKKKKRLTLFLVKRVN